MMTIEKAVRIVSDLHHFYRKIPKVSRERPMEDRGGMDRQERQHRGCEGTLESSGNLSASHR